MARNASNSGKNVKRCFLPLLLPSSIPLAKKLERRAMEDLGRRDLAGGQGQENNDNHGMYPGGTSQVPGIALSTLHIR